MDSASSNSEESYEMGYQPSLSSIDRRSEMTRMSCSLDSFAYCRTSSEASAAFSDEAEMVASPHSWQGLKSPAQTALLRLSMRQIRHGLDEEIMDLDVCLTG